MAVDAQKEQYNSAYRDYLQAFQLVAFQLLAFQLLNIHYNMADDT